MVAIQVNQRGNGRDHNDPQQPAMCERETVDVDRFVQHREDFLGVDSPAGQGHGPPKQARADDGDRAGQRRDAQQRKKQRLGDQVEKIQIGIHGIIS